MKKQNMMLLVSLSLFLSCLNVQGVEKLDGKGDFNHNKKEEKEGKEREESIIEADSLQNIEKEGVSAREIEDAGGIRQYVMDIFLLDDPKDATDEDDRLAREEVLKKEEIIFNNGRFKNKHEKDFKENISIPANGSCCLLSQSVGDTSCNLYSFLAAALQVPEFREKIAKMVVHQDENYVYVKFQNPIEKSIDLGSGDFYKAFDNTYKVKKQIHTGTMIPSSDPWVNIFTKAVYEHLVSIGTASKDGYDLSLPFSDGSYHTIFGSKIRVLDLKGNCVLTEDGSSNLCSEQVKLGNDGQIEIIKNNQVMEIINGKDKVIMASAVGHARSLFYDQDKNEWRFFDNQQSKGCGECGLLLSAEEVRKSLNSAQSIIIIAAD